ncbi:MAG: MFS transporter [Anaerolineaceae bacterium]
MKKVTVLQMLVVNAYWVGISFMWNSLHPIVLPAILLHLVPENQKNTWLGLLTFAGLIIAMLVQPLSGALSDRWASRWGRRRPFIMFGTLFDLLFLAFLGWSGGVLWVAIGYIGLQFTSNIAHGPMQGLLPDRVPSRQIGTASGFKNLIDMGGLIVSSLLAGRLLDGQTRHPVLIIAVIAAVLLGSMLVTVLGVKEEPVPRGQADSRHAAALFASFAGISIKSHSSFWRLMGSRLAFLIGVYGIQTFLQYYLRDVFQAPNPAKLTGDLMAVIAISLVALSVTGGWLCDRFGSKRVLYLAGGLGILGSLLLLTAHTTAALTAYGSILGAGIGLFVTANWALATRLAPAAEAGKFLGLTNLATAGAGAISKLEGPLIDLVNNANPGAYLGYYGLFALGALGAAISLLLLRRVQEPQPEPETETPAPADTAQAVSPEVTLTDEAC